MFITESCFTLMSFLQMSGGYLSLEGGCHVLVLRSLWS